jgi:hypothetical protein
MRRAVHARRFALREILVDFGRPGVRFEALLELGFVLHAGFFRPFHVIVVIERRLVFERRGVKLPERVAACHLENAFRRLGCRLGLLMERQRIALPDDADLFLSVGRLHLIHGRLDARAERTLEVAVDDDGDRRGAVAPHRIFAVHRNR